MTTNRLNKNPELYFYRLPKAKDKRSKSDTTGIQALKRGFAVAILNGRPFVGFIFGLNHVLSYTLY